MKDLQGIPSIFYVLFLKCFSAWKIISKLNTENGLVDDSSPYFYSFQHMRMGPSNLTVLL